MAIASDTPRTFTLEKTSVSVDHTTWVARSADAPGALPIATTANGGMDLIHHVEGGEEHFISVRGADVIVTWMADDFRCGTAEADTSGSAVAAEWREQLTEPSAQSGEINFADILFFYDVDTLALASLAGADGDGKRVILSMARLHTEATNNAMERSGVTNFRWRVVDAVQILHYDRTGYMLDDLMQITTTSLSLNTVQRFVRDESSRNGADEVVLYIGGDAEYAGMAWMPGRACVVRYGTSFLTLAHEVGHNLGLHHDRKTVGVEGGTTGYHYGHRFVHTHGRDVGDIMSYSVNRYPCYSNPDVTTDISRLFSAIDLIAPGMVTLGVPVGQPGASHCVRHITEAAAGMASFRPSILTSLPTFTMQPVGVVLSAGQTVGLSVDASGVGGLHYQWRINGLEIEGAINPTLVVDTSIVGSAGAYDCIVSNGLGRALSTVAVVDLDARRDVPAAVTQGRLVNISTRANVGKGDEILVGGVAITGGRARILVRAIGPSLWSFGVDDYLRDPVLDAYTHDGHRFASNDDWPSGIHEVLGWMDLFNLVGAFQLPPGTRDSLLLLDLEAGRYSFHVSGAGQSEGVALLELYLVEVPDMPGKLMNLSARARAGQGADVVIAGFVTEGAPQVLVRGVGPTLRQFGVASSILTPVLSLHRGDTVLDSVGGWTWTFDAAAATALFQKVGAFSFAEGSADAISVTTSSGTTTAIVRGYGNSRGIALAEIYVVEP